VAVDNPSGFNASILGEIKRINDRLDQLSAAPLGKMKFVTGWGPTITPVVTSTPSSTSILIAVPALATSCGYSVFASGGAANTTATQDFLEVTVTVTYGSYTHFTSQAQSNVQPGNEGNVTTPMVDTFTFPPGGGNLTLTASIQNGGSGSWTDTTNNAIFPEGLFVFQY
jgi:hypothetical protein